MLQRCPKYPRWALLVAVVALGISVTGSPAFANPSEVQYGYDPIVDPGGSKSDQTGSPESTAPGERVEEASAVIAAIVGGTGGKGGQGGTNGPGDQQGGVGEGVAAIDAANESSGSDSLLFIAILLTLSVGLAAWAVARRRSSGVSGTAELAVRATSFMAFLGLLILLNGSAGSILG